MDVMEGKNNNFDDGDLLMNYGTGVTAPMDDLDAADLLDLDFETDDNDALDLSDSAMQLLLQGNNCESNGRTFDEQADAVLRGDIAQDGPSGDAPDLRSYLGPRPRSRDTRRSIQIGALEPVREGAMEMSSVIAGFDKDNLFDISDMDSLAMSMTMNTNTNTDTNTDTNMNTNTNTNMNTNLDPDVHHAQQPHQQQHQHQQVTPSSIDNHQHRAQLSPSPLPLADTPAQQQRDQGQQQHQQRLREQQQLQALEHEKEQLRQEVERLQQQQLEEQERLRLQTKLNDLKMQLAQQQQQQQQHTSPLAPIDRKQVHRQVSPVPPASGSGKSESALASFLRSSRRSMQDSATASVFSSSPGNTQKPALSAIDLYKMRQSSNNVSQSISQSNLTQNMRQKRMSSNSVSNSGRNFGYEGAGDNDSNNGQMQNAQWGSSNGSYNNASKTRLSAASLFHNSADYRSNVGARSTSANLRKTTSESVLAGRRMLGLPSSSSRSSGLSRIGSKSGLYNTKRSTTSLRRNDGSFEGSTLLRRSGSRTSTDSLRNLLLVKKRGSSSKHRLKTMSVPVLQRPTSSQNSGGGGQNAMW